MKKLITVADVRKCIEEGNSSICAGQDTIVTPAARDLASEKGMCFTDKASEAKVCEAIKPENVTTVHEGCLTASDTVNSIAEQFKGIDKDLIQKIVKEVLSEMLVNQVSCSFQKESDPSGLKLIRGNTVVCDKFDEGNPGSNVGLKDIVSTKESPHMGAGFMTIEKSCFNWELCYEEFDYIVEGELDITINGNKYCGKAGDVFYIPKDSKITWSSDSKARYFYVTYPANWAEIAAAKK